MRHPLESQFHFQRGPAMRRTCFALIFSTSFAAATCFGQQRFTDLVGRVAARPVQAKQPIPVPFITWGGDVATFHANGGLATARGSTFDELGLRLQLTPGDNFPQQVKDYMSGKTPFLRGTYRMIAQANEVLGSSTETKPVIILQLSWSAGDHLVSRGNLKSLNDLKRPGKKVRIACQQGGPHVGLLYDALEQANLRFEDVAIEWVSDLTGPQGPAEAFRSNSSIDACCVITPDMIGLTGGMESSGSGAEGTVSGAHVLVSTQAMSRSIADVYAVRSDWYRANRATVDKFVAGYLKGTQAVVDMRRGFESTKRMSGEYRKTLRMAQAIFGADVLPTLEVDAHGLLLDCGFVGLAGQVAFFEDKRNLKGFAPMMKTALDMASSWGYSRGRFGFAPSGLDYRKIASLSGLKYEAPQGPAIVPGTVVTADGDNTIVSFTIGFGVDQVQFPAVQYGAEFMRAIKGAATFGNAVVLIRGHSDSWHTTVELLKAGMSNGTIRRTGQRPNYRYSVGGRRLDITSPPQIIAQINTKKFEGVRSKKGQLLQPLASLAAANGLSQKRANAVRDSLVNFARDQGVNLDISQIQTEGVGILEPVIAKPRNQIDAQKNRRVEFRIVRVPAEALQEGDFDF